MVLGAIAFAVGAGWRPMRIQVAMEHAVTGKEYSRAESQDG